MLRVEVRVLRGGEVGGELVVVVEVELGDLRGALEPQLGAAVGELERVVSFLAAVEGGDVPAHRAELIGDAAADAGVVDDDPHCGLGVAGGVVRDAAGGVRRRLADVRLDDPGALPNAFADDGLVVAVPGDVAADDDELLCRVGREVAGSRDPTLARDRQPTMRSAATAAHWPAARRARRCSWGTPAR
jgi:hypothetical protein